jgi:protein phosphatase
MKIADPLAKKFREESDVLLFAEAQEQGDRPSQQDAFLHFSDECFALADGVGGMPHGDVAASLAVETAVWGYKHIRQRRYYWEDKKLFMKRIFRTANMTVWQKHRESGFEDGLATTLAVAMIGPQSYWVGTAGDSAVFFFHDGVVTRLTREDRDAFGSLTKALGMKRLGLVPVYATGKFLPEDVLVLATDGVADYVSAEDMAAIVGAADSSAESLAVCGRAFLSHASAAGSTDNRTVLILKRIIGKP